MLRKTLAPVLAPFLAMAAGALALPASAHAAPPPAPPRAEIPFADHGGVDNWRAVSDREIWFEDLHHRWYRAILTSPAFDLPYAEYIGIDARPSGTLDKFGAIYVHGQHYPFASFEAMPGPPPKKARHR